MMIARYRATNASLEAMAKPGSRVCHESAVGVGADARGEGETQTVNTAARQVSVKVTKLGATPLIVAGSEVVVGDIVWDDPLHWIPCN
jgi:hypothetical protein